jgi:hypothetical protein
MCEENWKILDNDELEGVRNQSVMESLQADLPPHICI